MLAILGWLVVLLLVLGIATVVTFRRRPKAALAWLSRRALKKRGARFQKLAGPRGPLGYWTMGSGSPVVLLHGAGDQAGTWIKVAPALAERHRLLLPDLPGHEQSGPFEGPLDQGDMADALEALLAREVPEGKVALVGNSMGGWTALLYAARHPERVSVLVLEDAGGLSGIDLERHFAPRNREEARQLLRTTFGPDAPTAGTYVLDDLLRRVKEGPIARLLVADETPYYLDGKLGHVDVPAHLIWGEHDGLLPPDYARRLAAELPHAALHVLPGCGHIPHLQRPEDFLRAVRDILTATKTRTTGQ